MRFAILWLAVLPLAAQTPLKLSLSEAEALAVQQHPGLADAHFTTQAAAQVTRETRAPLYPQLTGAVTGVEALDNSRLAAGALNAGNLAPRLAGGVLLQQLITDFGRTGHLVNSSRLREQSAGQAEAATRASLILNVDRAYFRVQRALAVLRVAEQTRSARQVVSDQIGALMRSNLKSQLDLSFANVNLAEAQLLETTARNEIQEAFADLSGALGSGDTHTFELSEPPVDSPPAGEMAAAVSAALDSRPDIKGFRLDRDAALETAQAERALSRPTVTAAGAVGGVPVHTNALDGKYGAAGINVSIPVFNGSLYAARRTEAELRSQASASRVRDIENRVSQDTRVVWLQANTAYQRIALTGQLQAQADLALSLAQSRYDLGLSSIVELTQAQLNQTSAQIENLTSRYDYQFQLSALRYQTGH